MPKFEVMEYYTNWNIVDELEPERCVDEKDVGTMKYWGGGGNHKSFRTTKSNLFVPEVDVN